nr:unnamed protein product [Digitaria exilis]
MKLKQLEGLLGGLTQFPAPKVELEQYPTGPHIASRMLYTLYHTHAHINQAENSFDDITGKVVADFGCGCGTLAVASALLDAEHVIGIDVDPQALELAQENAADLEMDIDLIWSDIKNLNLKVFQSIPSLLSDRKQFGAGILVDTVVMNPPFGTRKKGADMEFLSMGLKVASQAVYSLHKTSTREHIKKAALRDCNAISAEVLCELRYDLPQTYKFHKKKEVDIAVDLWRFVPNARRSS